MFFTAFFAVIYIIGVCLIGTYLPSYFTSGIRYRRSDGGHLFTRVNEAAGVRNIDILFVGTSHCYRGFDTRIFARAGYSSFNLGSSIQTPLQTQVLLDRYLDRLNPKVVIFEVNPVVFANDGIESSLDLISNDYIDWRTVAMAFKVNRPKTYNTLIYGLYRQIFRNASQTEPLQYRGDKYIRGGFVETTSTRTPSKQFYEPVAYEITDKQLGAFADVLNMLKARKIPYVLVQAPVTKPLFQSKTNNRYIDSLLMSHGRYYNFNRLLVLNDTLDFFDDNHLTQRGVEKFNAELITLFGSEGLLP